MNEIECLAALKRIYIETLNLRKNHVDLTKNFCLLAELETEYDKLYKKIASEAPKRLILEGYEFPLKENEILCIPAHLHQTIELRDKQNLHELLETTPKHVYYEDAEINWWLDQERDCE